MQKTIKRNFLSLDRPWLWIMPAVMVLFIFKTFPVFESIRYSLTDMDLRYDDYIYTLDTYADILSDEDLPHMFYITFVFVAGSVIGQIVAGLLLALGLEYGVRNKIRGTNFVRVAVLVSWIIPGSVMGIIWQMVFNESPDAGIINHLISMLGFKPVNFVSNPNIAVVTVTITNIWKGSAFTMIMMYAGLQGIPRSLYDAASIDGANAWQLFYNIKLPLLKPVFFINLIMIFIATLSSFDMIYTFTGGGPGHATEVLALFLYNKIFMEANLSAGAVLTVILLAINIAFAVIYIKISKPDGLKD